MSIFPWFLKQDAEDLDMRVEGHRQTLGQIQTDIAALADRLDRLKPLDVRQQVDRIRELAGEAREDIDMVMTKVQADAAAYRARFERLEEALDLSPVKAAKAARRRRRARNTH